MGSEQVDGFRAELLIYLIDNRSVDFITTGTYGGTDSGPYIPRPGTG